ncbi:MAG TPA: type II toxin-antitoxin system RelE/ParE family toxin [Verrucomicrobiales bacterium]|nr:type II toxin-antitoxin system RelE/ParE family toxin [Verrucomicrobiales bacterium]
MLLQGAQVDMLHYYTRFGDAFYDRLNHVLGLLAENPGMGPSFRDPYRRLLIPHTPLGVFYTIQGPRIMVGAITNLTQDPARIHALLKSRS